MSRLQTLQRKKDRRYSEQESITWLVQQVNDYVYMYVMWDYHEQTLKDNTKVAQLLHVIGMLWITHPEVPYNMITANMNTHLLKGALERTRR